MSPETAARSAANQLMSAYKQTSPFSLGNTAQGLGFRAARSGKKYTLSTIANEDIDRAVRKIIPFMDYFPLKSCHTLFSEMVVEQVDKPAPMSETYSKFMTQILGFLSRFSSQGVWEAVFAVKGIDIASSGDFSIGDCQFYLMDEAKFLLWGRRYSTGKYDPPANAQIQNNWHQEIAMKDQIVVAVRVKSVNQEHARAKGRKRIEEVIDLLRYGQLVAGYPEHPIPELGLWMRQWQHDHSIVIQIDGCNSGTNKTLAGPIGCNFSLCRSVPAWNELERIVKCELADRSELELRLMTALKWIGQAAAAPADTIRLVSLVTALESLLIEQSESIGKRSKLTSRIASLTSSSDDERATMAEIVDDLYRLRSECVHAGLLDIEKDEIHKCVHVLRETIASILTKAPFSQMQRLAEVLDCIESGSATSEAEKQHWICNNAYFRWLNENAWSASGCPPTRHSQHWADAEREFYSSRFLRREKLDESESD